MPPRSGQPWMYGFLDLCLLSLLAERRDYGLGLAQRLADAGLGDVPGGTLYPALLRLESQGYVHATPEPSPSGPPRRYFALTPAGSEAGAALRRQWAGFRDGVDTVARAAGDRAASR